ncbi:MAG: hypothetical protein F6K41_09050 [Symploca sp. SIO3E6]|nr:hypothetical protein [Caldora sp. SIO3E6]
MSGNVIDSSARALLILIVPIALITVLFLKAWPFVLALLVITISFQFWQQYQWQQWSKQINPFFNRLIKENQGCLTPLDLSIKANISGAIAQQYLDKRAEEFGAQRQVYEDKGTVYYFLTANALGSIFNDSEPVVDLENELVPGEVVKRIEALKPEQVREKRSGETSQQTQGSRDTETGRREIPPPTSFTQPEAPTPEVKESSSSEVANPPEPSTDQKNSLSQALSSVIAVEADRESSTPQEQSNSQSLIQGELAKRLDVHSSTVGKHKSDPDFPQWSQSRDPEGIAWKYSSETKEFSPIDNLEGA